MYFRSLQINSTTSGGRVCLDRAVVETCVRGVSDGALDSHVEHAPSYFWSVESPVM
jgi:hypothetical protein